MTLIFFDGFTDPQTVPKSGWSGSIIRDGGGRSGYCLNTGGATLALPSTAESVFVGAAWHHALYGSRTPYWTFSNTAGPQVKITWPTDSLMEVRRATGSTDLLGSAVMNPPLSISNFGHFQVHAILKADSTGYVEVKREGVTVATFTGQTSSTNDPVAELEFGNSSSGFYHYMDDLWVCDGVDATATQGRPNNGFLGDLSVVRMLPTTTNTPAEWTPSTGTNHAALVNEVAPNTSNYISATAPDLVDMFNMDQLAGDVTMVFGIQQGTYAQKSDSGTGFVTDVRREAGGSIVEGDTTALETGWGGLWSDPVYLADDGNVWEPSDVNGLEIGVKSA